METAQKRRRSLRPTGHTVSELIPTWLEAVKAESGPIPYENCRHWILPFKDQYGFRQVDDIRPPDLFSYRQVQSKTGALSSANVRLATAKRFLTWCALMEYRPPIQTQGVRRLAVGPRPEKEWPVDQVKAQLLKARQFGRTDNLFRHLAIQYVCCARPTEVLRLVAGTGEFESPGVFRLAVSKTEKKNGVPRRLIVGDLGLDLLKGARSAYCCAQSYWRAATDATDVGTHRYRHSAAAHLAALLPAQEFSLVRLMLGHYSDLGVTTVYARPDWASLRRLSGMLAENVPA